MILVAGESLVDLITDPMTGRTVAHAGGSPANVATALARLGQPVSLLTQIGADSHGRLLLDHLTGSGVRFTADSLLDDAPTSVARTDVNADGHASYTFNLRWRSFRGTVPPGTQCVHTGSAAAVVSPGAQSVAALLREARGSATISYDPNCRPSLMGDPERARRRVEALIGMSDIVKISLDDLAWLYPNQPYRQVAEGWLERGIRLAVVTLGAAGAWATTHLRSSTVNAVPVEVADTVGAGDAFTAGLLFACAERNLLGADRRDALADMDETARTATLRFAAHTAAITCGRRGADPPLLAELPR
ncbi:carbohydrate kinase family protein [Actinoplanes regularis]|uniref:carbohydrate kinase family protein n=1 Tax=Actinoplanes regularis TaxID=52697 RepID=UPI0024A2F1BD|nr:carbohydrate kinase [Actinoplanes regularis]GLW34721.1 ribokinase [Actinoplanes regularis]